MPADTDVLVAGSSPISFSSSYLPYLSSEHDYNNETRDILISNSSYRSAPLDFPSALSCSPNSSSYLNRSPTIFGTTPPTHFTFHGRCNSPALRHIPSSAIALKKNLSHLHVATSDYQMPVAVPRRPCLVVRCDVLDLPSPSKNKKRVVFADDRGFPLTLVSNSFFKIPSIRYNLADVISLIPGPDYDRTV